MTINKVFGPPGSGKTTYLLNVVEKELANEVSPLRIGYFAFTRKAATEARERAMEKFPHLKHETDFPWFRTLHSLAYRCLGVGMKDMMKPEHYREFAKLAGLQMEVETGDEEYVVKTDNPILNEINIARIRGEDLRAHYNRSALQIEWYHFEYVERAYRKYKENRGLIDFTDLLEQIILRPEFLPKLETVIVDEAQDLSRLQWGLVHALSERSNTMYIAGDDDQCQPAGTMVLTAQGSVPIERLDPKKHRIMCYDRNGSYVVGKKAGYGFKHASRNYEGFLYKVTSGGNRSSYTDNHRCLVRWKPAKDVAHFRVVYLMQRGPHFRIGQCQLFRADGCVHAWVRAHLEDAENMWFLKLVDNFSDAHFWENYLSYLYGIPQTVFRSNDPEIQERAHRLHGSLFTRDNALELLQDLELSYEFPFYEKAAISNRRGGSQIFDVRACNLMPDLMLLPSIDGDKVRWEGFKLKKEWVSNKKVYSLEVEKHHNYFADNILTHNCVYSWAGADVQTFLSLDGETKVLEQSYRIPAVVHELANKVVKRIRNRQPKVWKPREEQGAVVTYNDYAHVDISSGDWLILAATNYMLNDMHSWIKSQGLLFERHGHRSISEKVMSAVLGWEALRRGKEVDAAIVENIYKHMGTEFIKRGHKSLKTIDPEKTYTIETLETDHGLLTREIWHEVLTKIGEDKREYIIALLRRGVKLTGKIPIKLSTIHGAKGGEADNVLLLTDLSGKFAKEYVKNSDDINRLLYVGITRARKALHIVLPKNEEKGFRL